MNHETLETLEGQKESHPLDDNGFYQVPLSYFNGTLPLSFPPVGRSQLSKLMTNSPTEKSKILEQEMRGFHNIIISEDSEDILKTVRIIN